MKENIYPNNSVFKHRHLYVCCIYKKLHPDEISSGCNQDLYKDPYIHKNNINLIDKFILGLACYSGWSMNSNGGINKNGNIER